MATVLCSCESANPYSDLVCHFVKIRLNPPRPLRLFTCLSNRYKHTKAGYVQHSAPLTTAKGAGGKLGVDVRVSRDGKVVAAGANQLNNFVGGVFVWRLVKGTWTPMGAPILPTTVGTFALFGTNLGIDKIGQHLVASAPIAGTVLIYRWNKLAQVWVLVSQVQSDVVTTNTAFGAGVAMTWNAQYVGGL
jgi:hypothetical protein